MRTLYTTYGNKHEHIVSPGQGAEWSITAQQFIDAKQADWVSSSLVGSARGIFHKHADLHVKLTHQTHVSNSDVKLVCHTHSFFSYQYSNQI